MSQEFNFDIDKIANNAISKSDKTTEIIEANTTQENSSWPLRRIKTRSK